MQWVRESRSRATRPAGSHLLRAISHTLTACDECRLRACDQSRNKCTGRPVRRPASRLRRLVDDWPVDSHLQSSGQRLRSAGEACGSPPLRERGGEPGGKQTLAPGRLLKSLLADGAVARSMKGTLSDVVGGQANLLAPLRQEQVQSGPSSPPSEGRSYSRLQHIVRRITRRVRLSSAGGAGGFSCEPSPGFGLRRPLLTLQPSSRSAYTHLELVATQGESLPCERHAVLGQHSCLHLGRFDRIATPCLTIMKSRFQRASDSLACSPRRAAKRPKHLHVLSSGIRSHDRGVPPSPAHGREPRSPAAPSLLFAILRMQHLTHLLSGKMSVSRTYTPKLSADLLRLAPGSAPTSRRLCLPAAARSCRLRE